MLSALALAMTIGSAQAQHGHLNVGATGRNQGDALNWNNGAAFVAESGYVKTMNFATTGTYANFFEGNISLTSMHSTNGFGETIAGSPAPGSFQIGEIVSVTGPEGGAFGFWDTNGITGPSLSVPVGTTAGGFFFDLSEAALGAGEPGGDPFGHVHGRRLTFTKAGIYEVGLRAIDISTNGANGGPIHTRSEVLRVVFQAGYNIKQITWANGVATVTVGTAVGSVFKLQANTDLNNPNGWQDVGEVVGNDLFQNITDEQASEAARFYRVAVQPVTP